MLENSKKILMVIDLFHPVIGGAETQAMLLSQGLVKNGYKVTVLTQKGIKGLSDKETVHGIEIHRLSTINLSGFHKFRSILPAAIWLIKNRIGYDLIHCHGANPLTWSVLFTKPILNKPYFVKLTRTNFLDYVVPPSAAKRINNSENLLIKLAKISFHPFLKFIRSELLRKSNGIFAINDEIQKSLVDSNFKNVTNIPNGVDIEKYAPATIEEKDYLRAKLGLPANKKILIYTGRFTEEKNIKRLLEAWADLTKQKPNLSAELILLGSGEVGKNNLEDELKEFTQEHNLTSISFKGYVSNVTEFLKASDIFVLPSLGEGLSNSLLEAMSCGLTPVVSDIPGNRTLVKNNLNGLLFKPENTEQLKNCLIQLLSHDSILKKMSSQARKTIVDSFSISAVIDKIVKKYNRCPYDKKND